MQTSKIFLIPLCAAVMVVGGYRLWQQQREIDQFHRRNGATAAELSRRATEKEELETHLRDVQKEATSLRTELTRAQEEQKSLLEKGVPRRNDGVPLDANQVNAEMLKQWMTDADDSTVLRRLNLEARNKTLQRYGELIEQLALTPEEAGQFTKLLTDKRQAALDVAVLSYQRGEDPTNDMEGYRDLIAKVREASEADIHVLLGEAKYAQYQDYVRSAGQTNVLNNLQLALRGTNAALTADQVARFTAVLQDSNATKITPKVINDARKFLTAQQLQTLQDLRAVEQADAQKRDQPIQALPNAPPVPEPEPKAKE